MQNGKTIIGILAHVDAGKTTLSEALLYLSGQIRKQGRVDKGNSFLDNNPLERERGITIFSKQARFTYEDREFILVDTPGHTDFSAECERTLQVLDYAILVINSTDGLQSHTYTLWQLLKTWHIPTILFVNKMDLPSSVGGINELVKHLQGELDAGCIPFLKEEDGPVRDERLAQLSEELLEQYLDEGSIPENVAAQMITTRNLFPCFFGSALRLEGVDYLLKSLPALLMQPVYDEGNFGGRIYKINYSQGQNNERLTWMKVTAGRIKAKESITYKGKNGETLTEKINQIRTYSGDHYEQKDTVEAGDICAVIGLSSTYAGEGIGQEDNAPLPILEPVLQYGIVLPNGIDPKICYPKFKQMEEEDPLLHFSWVEELQQIQVSLMGTVQTEVLKRLAHDRFDLDIETGPGEILYKERPMKKVIGIGHFEPLRHYAEVQLLLEPLPYGSGLVYECSCPTHVLDKNWQRLVLTHLEEKNHRGVLLGAPLTDAKITLLAGRASIKHTEGGDFREATYRAVRQGLMRSGCELLEPYYLYRLEIPHDFIGRAVSDLQVKSNSFELNTTGKAAIIAGRAPVSAIQDYATDVSAYTKGLGKWSSQFDGYGKCLNQDVVLASHPYDPCSDLTNTPDSVFCAHGAGFVVPWTEVENYKHIDISLSDIDEKESAPLPSIKYLEKKYELDEKELESIMLREFGPVKRRKYKEPGKLVIKGNKVPARRESMKSLLIIDGYNLIFSWDYLQKMATEELGLARRELLDILSNYVAFTKNEVVIVFDAYNVSPYESGLLPELGESVEHDGPERIFKYNGFTVVYTAEHQTADSYIEREIHRVPDHYMVRVITSDRLVQFSAVHAGVFRMSSREFQGELIRIKSEISKFISSLEP